MSDKREKHAHYFMKKDGTWVCKCGAQRDRNGYPLKEPVLRVV